MSVAANNNTITKNCSNVHILFIEYFFYSINSLTDVYKRLMQQLMFVIIPMKLTAVVCFAAESITTRCALSCRA